jgi:Protein of unknown function DUF262
MAKSRKKSSKILDVASLLDILEDESITPPTRDLWGLRDLWDVQSDLDFNPSYQRGFVWGGSDGGTTHQVSLINSIRHGIPINSIHLVETLKPDGGKKYIVLDGKQRLTSILKFMKNEFQATFRFGSERKSLKYSDLQELAGKIDHPLHARAKDILHKFLTFKIDILMWHNLTLPQQSVVFNTINFGVPLSSEENALAEHYHDKVFISHLMGGLFKLYSSKSKFKEDQRSRDYIWNLRLLYCLLHPSTTSVEINPNRIKSMSLKATDFKTFMKNLHLKIEDYLEKNKNTMIASYESPEEMTTMLESFGWLDDLKDVAKFLDDVANKIVGSKTGVNDWSMMYFTAFVLNKYQQKILTYGVFSDRIREFHDMFTNYINWINNDKELTRRMMDAQNYDKHWEALQKFFVQHIVEPGFIDDNPKSKYIPKDFRDKALKECGKICPICKEPLDKDIDFIEVDHHQAAATHSNTGKYVAMHRRCNRRKSDHTPESAQQLSDYLNDSKLVA